MSTLFMVCECVRLRSQQWRSDVILTFSKEGSSSPSSRAISDDGQELPFLATSLLCGELRLVQHYACLAPSESIIPSLIGLAYILQAKCMAAR
jgi:hypothetical protein